MIQTEVAVVDEFRRPTCSVRRSVSLTVFVEFHRHVLRKRNELRSQVIVQRNVLLGECDVATVVDGHPLAEPNAHATATHQRGRDRDVEVFVNVVRHAAIVHHECGVVHHVQRGILTCHGVQGDRRRHPNRSFGVHQDDQLLFLGHIATGIRGDVGAVEDRASRQVEASRLFRRAVHPNHFHHAVPIERTIVVDGELSLVAAEDLANLISLHGQCISAFVEVELNFKDVWSPQVRGFGVRDVQGVRDRGRVAALVNGSHGALDLVATCAVTCEGFTVFPSQLDGGVEVVGCAGPVLGRCGHPNAILHAPAVQCTVLDLEWVQAVGAVNGTVDVHILTLQHRGIIVLDVDVLLELTHVATSVLRVVSAGHAARVGAGVGQEGLVKPNVHHTGAIVHHVSGLVDVSAIDDNLCWGSRKIRTLCVDDCDFLTVNRFVAVVVVGHPEAEDDEVAWASRRELFDFLVERHGTACIHRLIATGVQWIPLAAVVNDIQARHVDAPTAGVVVQVAPLDRRVHGGVDERRRNGVIDQPHLIVVRRGVGNGVHDRIGQLDKLASAIGVLERGSAQIGNHVTREAHHRLSVQHPLPAKPTGESIFTIVVVRTLTKLESLVL